MSKWTDFVKQYAQKNNLSYGCALSDPNCSAEYKGSNTAKPKSAEIQRRPKPVKEVPKPEPVKEVPKPKPKPKPKIISRIAKESVQQVPKSNLVASSIPISTTTTPTTPTPISQSKISPLIAEFDNETTFPILVAQSPEFSAFYKNAEKIVNDKKKKYIISADLYFDEKSKKVLNDALAYWGKKEGYLNAIKRIENQTRNVLEYIGADNSRFGKLDIDTYALYLKRLNASNKRELDKVFK